MAEAVPICPFCNAPWSRAMIEQLEASTIPGGCACCVDGPSPAHVIAWPIPTEPMPEPKDLVCSSCGKVLYAAYKGDNA